MSLNKAFIKQLIWRMSSALFLDKVNLTFVRYLNGKRIKIPTIGKTGYSNLWTSELWMIDLLKNLLPLKTGAFVDIGVNLGQTLIKLKCIEPNVQYIGFEPNPMCVYYTRQLINKNRFRNCELIPVGISNKSEIMPLNLYGSETDSSATIVAGFRQQQIKYQFLVPIESFEHVYPKLNLKSVSIMKIDVEGGELEVIQSARSLLEKDRPFVLCEVLPVYSMDNSFRKSRQEEIEKIMKAVNYFICRIEKSESGHLRGIMRIETFGIHSNLSLCDYLFGPTEMFENVSKQLRCVQ